MKKVMNVLGWIAIELAFTAIAVGMVIAVAAS